MIPATYNPLSHMLVQRTGLNYSKAGMHNYPEVFVAKLLRDDATKMISRDYLVPTPEEQEPKPSRAVLP